MWIAIPKFVEIFSADVAYCIVGVSCPSSAEKSVHASRVGLDSERFSWRRERGVFGWLFGRALRCGEVFTNLNFPCII